MRGPLIGPRDGCATQRKVHSKAAKVRTKFSQQGRKDPKEKGSEPTNLTLQP